LVDGGGADDSMVDLSENVPEVLQQKSSTSGPGSLSEQNSRLMEAILTASSRRENEAEAVKTQASTAVLVACIKNVIFMLSVFCSASNINTKTLL
jgi:ElaB/YqjD/DUF883 family membrane-anchored ribosome-binding protein